MIDQRKIFLVPLALLLAFIVPDTALSQYSPETQQQIDDYNKIIKSPFSSRIEKADALNGLGFVYRFNLDYQRAIEAHEESLALFEKENHPWGRALSYSYLGYVYMAKKTYSTALDYLEYSYDLFTQNDYPEDASYVLLQIGYLYLQKSDDAKALSTFEKCYKISSKASDEPGMVAALSAMGAFYQTKGDLPKALNYFEQGLAINRETKNKVGIAISLLDLAWVYFEQGNFYQVIECGKESLELFTDEYNKVGIANSLNIIGAGYKELGDYETALTYLLKSLKQHKANNDKSGIAVGYNNVGTVYFMQKNLPEALKYHEMGLNANLELGSKYDITLSTNNVGEVYFSMGDIEKGKEYAQKSEKMALEFGNPRLIKNAKQLLFEIAIHEKNMTAAEEYGLGMIAINDKAIEINFPTLSESEKEKFFQNISAEYMEFNHFVLTRKAENPALTEVVYNNTLRQKGLSLKSSTAMRNAILTSKDTALISQYNKWIGLKSEISAAYTNGDDASALEEKANALEKILVKGSQAFSDFDKVQNLTWKDVQKSLKENEIAIEFIHFNDFGLYGEKSEEVSYCALVVTPGCTYPEMIRLCAEKDLVALLGTFGGNNLNYINTIYGTSAQPNARLYELVWKPLEPFLGNSKTVYLSPSGLLHRVAFSALSKEKDVLLCDTYQLRLQSSTGKVAMPDEFNLGSNWKITLFGGIDYDTDSAAQKIWSFLEGTKVEVDNISALFSSGNYKVEQSTTEEGFKENAPGSEIIHLSTHGFFYPDPEKLEVSFEQQEEESGDLVFRGTSSAFGVKTFVFNKNPLMRSGLVMAGANRVWNNTSAGNGEDGVLTAYEVAQIDLRKTGLVVLSACETGLGDINGSEGVYGLQRSFKMAGVKYIIMSLWQVPDKETQEFMTLFYKKLLAVKDARLAFVQTQAEMRKKYDPYYWAAFVLVE